MFQSVATFSARERRCTSRILFALVVPFAFFAACIDASDPRADDEADTAADVPGPMGPPAPIPTQEPGSPPRRFALDLRLSDETRTASENDSGHLLLPNREETKLVYDYVAYDLERETEFRITWSFAPEMPGNISEPRNWSIAPNSTGSVWLTVRPDVTEEVRASLHAGFEREVEGTVRFNGASFTARP